MMAPTQWIERNMIGTYSEALGRPLTEPEVRVQRCLERMPVPDWYQKYSRPTNFLKNCIPFECRPASWKIYKKPSHTPRKTPKKRSSVKKSPQKSESESSRTSTADSGYKEAYRDTRGATSGTESDSPKIEEELSPTLKPANKSFRSPLNASNSYPRMSRSRKIENINIVFSQPFPARKERLQLDVPPKPPIRHDESPRSTPKTVYTITKNFELEPAAADVAPAESPKSKKSHASFLIADVKPSGVTTQVQVFAGPLTSDSGSSDEEQPQRSAPSPHTKFLNSAKKSTALEKIVQTRRTESGSLIQKIIDELNRSNCNETTGAESLSPEAQSFVKSMVHALEQSCYTSSEEEEEDRQSSSSDSELAKSTSISFKSYDQDSADDQPSSPLPTLSAGRYNCSSEEEEEEEYWIPCYNKSLEMPRTSSQMSNSSNGSDRRSGQNSPGLSPIKREMREEWQKHPCDWGMTYNTRDIKTISRRLFRIDETGVGDSGYSDRSTSASSRTATLCSEHSSTSRRSTSPPSSSAASTPTLLTAYQTSKLALSRSREPYVIKSFFV